MLRPGSKSGGDDYATSKEIVDLARAARRSTTPSRSFSETLDDAFSISPRAAAATTPSARRSSTSCSTVSIDNETIYDICRRSLDIERSPRPSPDTAIHIVYVAQTSCPTCVINGVDSLSREACFPYVDAALLQPRYCATPDC